MKFWDFVFGNRYGLAIWMIIGALLLSVILGAIFGLIIEDSFWECTQGMFWWFCAPAVAGALLLILTPIEEELSFGFGCGIYYGTFFVAEIFSISLFSAFLIAALACFAVWAVCFN